MLLVLEIYHVNAKDTEIDSLTKNSSIKNTRKIFLHLRKANVKTNEIFC